MTSSGAQNIRFRIVGHTDSVGTDESNKALSERRAAAVKDYLVFTHGISPSRLETAGMGKADPLNKANPAAAENRRVEFINLGS
jgi:outer membrane protein OmpA-like peptidoglycan-associated protein